MQKTSGKIETKVNASDSRLTREEISWIMYDWANSVYAVIMMSAVFPIYFTNIANLADKPGDYWWGLGTSFAMVIVALSAPLAGALSDYTGYRKKLFSLFLAVGLVFTLLCAFSENWLLLLCFYVLSHVGFSGSCLIYDSFLPDITTADKLDKISGYGYAFGYIGGSTIPFLASIALVTFGGNFGIGQEMAVKISIWITVIWWFVFTVPFLKNVHQRFGVDKQRNANIVKDVFKSVGNTAKKIFNNKKVFVFILAYFFYIDGVGTVINMSTSYGAALGLDTSNMILALLLTQFVAFPCSIGFAKLTKEYGALNMIRAAIFEYFLICALGFVMGFGLEEGFFGIDTARTLFWALAFLVGTVQGGIQAASRSYFAKMIPPENSGEFFGFFDIFGKFASIMGPFLYAVVKALTGRSSYSILSIILLFAAAFMILTLGRKYVNEV